MRRLSVFNNITLDGYFADAHGDMSFAHGGADDPEFAAWTGENASGGGALVFGRVTYEMMAAFWPTDMAKQQVPAVAEGMNRMEKIVFSRSLKEAAWNNTRLVQDDPAKAMAAIKREDGSDMVILGSGRIVAQLADAGLIDAYQFVIAPIALGAGRTQFDGMKKRLALKLTDSRTFKNGKVVVSYAAG